VCATEFAQLGLLANVKLDTSVSRFLNRILGSPLKLQNAIFDYFLEHLKAVIAWARLNDKYDTGIMDLGHRYEKLSLINDPPTTVFVDPSSKIETFHYEVLVDRGISWEVANAIYADRRQSGQLKLRDGFYCSKHTINGNPKGVHLVLSIPNPRHPQADPAATSNAWLTLRYRMFRPHLGEDSASFSWEEIIKVNSRVFTTQDIQKAEKEWKRKYELSATQCSHLVYSGNCKNMRMLGFCHIGMRKKTVHVLGGAILPVSACMLKNPSRHSCTRIGSDP
jgi:hypothetical protein